LVNEVLQEDKVVYVLDAPSTGHAIAMIESIFNYEKIFSIGPLKKDLVLVKNFLMDPQNVTYAIVANPDEMSLEESSSLYEKFVEINPSNDVKIFLTKILSENLEVVKKTHYWNDLFLSQQEGLNNWRDKSKIDGLWPFYPELHALKLIQRLAKHFHPEKINF